MLYLVVLFYTFNLVICFSNNINNHNLLPNYHIPKWVYKDVFEYNKPYKYKKNVLKKYKKNVLKKYKTNYHDNIIDYNTIHKLNLPCALLQNINKY